MMANSGKFTINMISEALTHKNVDFTKKKYAHFLPETLAAIGNAAADVLQCNHNNRAEASRPENQESSPVITKDAK